MNDEALLEARWLDACLGGDMEAFGQVVERYRGRLFRVAYGMLRNAEDAEDVVQESFVRAYEALERFDRRRPLGPWLVAIASRLSIDRIRGRGRAKRLRQETSMDTALQPLPPQDAEGGMQRRELRQALNAAVAALEGRMRAVLILRDVEGFSGEEVAEMLGIEPATVRVHLFKARARLREILTERRAGAFPGAAAMEETP